MNETPSTAPTRTYFRAVVVPTTSLPLEKQARCLVLVSKWPHEPPVDRDDGPMPWTWVTEPATEADYLAEQKAGRCLGVFASEAVGREHVRRTTVQAKGVSRVFCVHTPAACHCAACETGAGTCLQNMTDDDMLAAFGFDRAGRVRAVGKGSALRESVATLPGGAR